MNNKFFYIVLLCLLLVFSISACSREKPDCVVLDKGWQYRIGDSPVDENGKFEWTYKGLDSGEWKSIDGPVNPPDRKENSIVWYRVKLPSEIKNNYSIFIPFALIKYEVYIDTEFIFSFGKVNVPSTEEFPGLSWKIIDIDKHHKGKTLYIRMYSDYILVGFVGNLILASRENQIRRIINDDFVRIIIAVIFQLLALVSFIFYLCNREHLIFLGFSLFTLGLGIYRIIHTDVIIIMYNIPKAGFAFWFFSIFIMPIGYVLFFKELVAEKYRRIFLFFIYVFIFYIIASMPVIVFRLYNPIYIRIPYYYLLIVGIIMVIIISIVESFKGNIEVRIILLFLGVTLITVSLEIFRALFGLFFAFKDIINIAMLILIAGMSYILIRRLVLIRKEQTQLQKKVLEVSEDERKNIGMELHDGLGHALLEISIKAGMLVDKLEYYQSPEVNNAKDIEKQVMQAIKKNRGLAKGLFPVNLESSSINEILYEIKKDLEENHNIDCTLEIDESIETDKIKMSKHLYFLIQEAVKNIIKHSEADKAWINLRKAGNEIVISIKDNGRGIDMGKTGHDGMGLNIMKYRAQMIGARFDIRSEAGKGVEVVCRVDFLNLV